VIHGAFGVGVIVSLILVAVIGKTDYQPTGRTGPLVLASLIFLACLIGLLETQG